MRWTGLLWLLLAVSSAAPARAVLLDVTFDLSSSTISLLGGVIQVPPDGSVGGGTATLRFSADPNTFLPIAGPAAILDASLALTLDADLLGQAHITGPVQGHRVGGALASLNGPLTQLSLLSPLLVLYTGTVQCAGSGCGAVGTFPVSLGTVLGFAGAFGVGNLAAPGSATLQASLPFSLAGFTGILQLSGAEIQRAVVPEPRSAGLLGLGLAILAIAAPAARRRRAAPQSL